MRSLTTLYKIAYGRLMLASDGEYAGLCYLIYTLEKDKLITFEEAFALREDLDKNRPTEKLHIEFSANPEYDIDGLHWWPRGQVEPRLRFLKRMIYYSRPWYIKFYLIWTNQV